MPVQSKHAFPVLRLAVTNEFEWKSDFLATIHHKRKYEELLEDLKDEGEPLLSRYRKDGSYGNKELMFFEILIDLKTWELGFESGVLDDMPAKYKKLYGDLVPIFQSVINKYRPAAFREKEED